MELELNSTESSAGFTKNNTNKMRRDVGSLGINELSQYHMSDALAKVVGTTISAEKFEDRFINSVNTFNTIVIASTYNTNKKTQEIATTMEEATRILRDATRNFFNKSKEHDASTDEFINMMKLGMKDTGLFPSKRKQKVKPYYEVGNEADTDELDKNSTEHTE